MITIDIPLLYSMFAKMLNQPSLLFYEHLVLVLHLHSLSWMNRVMTVMNTQMKVNTHSQQNHTLQNFQLNSLAMNQLL